MTSSTQLMWGDLSRANALNPAQRHRWRLIVEEVASAVDLGQAPLVVDLGCGSGMLLHQVKRISPRAKVVGFEVEPLAIDLVRRNVPDAEIRLVDLSEASVSLADSLAGSADVVLCSEVLEHLEKPESAVRLARTLLRPGGIFVVTVPSGPITPFDRAIGHLRHYDLPTVGRLLEQSGFSVAKSYLWGFPFHTLFRMLVGMFKTVPGQWRDDQFSWATAFAFRVLDKLFFVNVKSRRWGRQVVAAAINSGA